MTVLDQPPTRRTQRTRRARRSVSLRTVVVAVVIAFAGVTVMMYPSAASWFSELQQRDQLEGYAQQLGGTDAGVLAERLAAARDYNSRLGGGVLLDPFTTATTAGADAGGEGAGSAGAGTVAEALADYRGQITENPGDVMAELRIADVGALLPIYHGTSVETLERGIGHLYGSSLPVGGEGTHAVLTGHRGYPEATLFSDLDKLGAGDTFTLTTLGETLVYRVTGTDVVEPDDTSSLAIVPGHDLVTLITCTPIGVNSHRLLVHAERVTVASDDPVAVTPEIPLSFPWWMVVLAASGAVGLTVVAIVWRRSRPPAR